MEKQIKKEKKDDKKKLTPMEQRMANLKNFKKGQSGNPNGRPKGKRNWYTDMEDAMKLVAEQNGWTISDIHTRLIAKGLTRALAGDSKFWEKIVDREYGKLKEEVEVAGGVNITVVDYQKPKPKPKQKPKQKHGNKDTV